MGTKYKLQNTISDWNEFISGFVPKLDVSNNVKLYYLNFMVMISILGLIPVILQAKKIYISKDSSGVSLYATFFDIFLSLLWVIYGLIVNSGIIVISSGLSVIFEFVIVILRSKYLPKP